MPRPRRQLTTTASAAVVVALLAGVTGCSRSYDTTQLSASDRKPKSAAPTTSIVVETVPTTTVPEVEPVQPLAAATDVQATLSQLVSSFAIDPQLLSQVQMLGSGDLLAVAQLFGLDLNAIKQLGMSVSQIAALGQSVANSGPAVLGQLMAGAGVKAGPIDAGTLIGLLTGTVDVNGLAQGAIASLVQLLSDTIAKTEIKISPEITIYLDQLLKEIDPNGLGQISADPANASFIALITSVILGANPLFAQQLLTNPLLDPKLKGLLEDLEALNASLGTTASAAILAALKAIFPDLAV